MKQYAKLAVALIPLLLAVGCGSKPPAGEEAGEQAVEGGVEAVAPGDGGAATALDGMADGADARTGEAMGAMDGTGDVDRDLLRQTKIYFDFDRSEIKPEFRAIVEAHAANLSANPSMTVTIEGHCDERGTREYNIALGERRAHSVLRMLTLNGVSASQIKTVSYGEEQPEEEGHDEAAWSKNRRAVFVYNN